LIKCCPSEFDKPNDPSQFSKSIGLVLCGIVDEPTSDFIDFYLK